jgi:hypothetical protein
VAATDPSSCSQRQMSPCLCGPKPMPSTGHAVGHHVTTEIKIAMIGIKCRASPRVPQILS